MGCNNFDNDRTQALVEASLRGENSGIESCPPEVREAIERSMPKVEEELRRLDEEETRSKEELEQQAKEAEHLDIKVDPEDFPKAVQAIPVRGFDVSNAITNPEVKEWMRDNPMLGVHQRFFPGKLTSIEYSDKRELQYVPGKEGKPTLSPVLGETKIDSETGQKRIVINEHRERDLPILGVTTKKDGVISTTSHETNSHVFGEDMLSKEAKDKLEGLFKEAKVIEAKGEKVFVTPYAAKSKWEYLGESWAWYSDPVHRTELEGKDPGLHNFIKETEEECKEFLAISKNLILVRGGKK